MKNKSKNTILFVINPVSGNQPNTDYRSIISAYSGKYHFEYSILETSGKNDREDIQAQITKTKPEMVIAAGGDGTINMVAAALPGTGIKFGIIPTGSANGLAYNLALPNNFEDALQKNLSGSFKPIDAILINQQYYCFHLADVGVNARIVKRFEQEGSKGITGYAKQFFKELFSPKTSFAYTIDGGTGIKKSKAEMLVIANAGSYGTGVQINSASKLDDGLFEVVVVKPNPWWFVFTFLLKGYAGKLQHAKYVEVFQFSKASINLKEKQVFQIDGEIVDNLDHIEMEIVPHALDVISG